jgi:GNAT superfamily N-acetyltransferase
MNEDSLTFRPAIREDLERIVQLLADDPLGSKREAVSLPIASSYERAFEAIAGDLNNELVVAEQAATVVGVLQLTFIPYLTHQGSWRALIEGVRVAAEVRSTGVGKQLFIWAIGRARERGCRMVQLTSDKSRPDAIRFYQSLGFTASHEGMKLQLAYEPASDA